DKRSDRALNTFLASNRPRVSHQDRPREVRRVAEATAATGAAAVTTKRGRRGSGKNNPKSVSAAERVANNHGEGFTVSFGKLYCEPAPEKSARIARRSSATSEAPRTRKPELHASTRST
ncbi:unnamed protein product, partial [Laminaria digitata]